MMDENNSIKYIFGLKVRDLRTERQLSFQDLSRATGLSISYLSEIEKGKKYPKGDKILHLAQALQVQYDDLVSLRVPKRLEPVVHLLQSNFLREFPLEMFGLDAHKIIDMVAIEPEKINAFLSAVFQIGRNYEMRQEQFYFAALRSYQELKDNYFPELEAAVGKFRKDFGLKRDMILHTAQLEEILTQHFGVNIDRFTLPKYTALKHLRTYYLPSSKTFMINAHLTSAQENFLIARELAFQYLNLEERPAETPFQHAGTFREMLNSHHASYFSAALLLEKFRVIHDIRQFAQLSRWDEARFLQFLTQYNVTPEMLLQRLTNILPRYFNIHNLFFLRFVGTDNVSNYELTKELHLSQLHHPHANYLNEHYCRRWISLDIIQQLRSQQRLEPHEEPMAGAQISSYWQTPNQYLCIAMAKPNESDPKESISVTIGFLINDQLKQQICFLNDPDLPTRTVHTTCERCSILSCDERMAPPTVVEEEQQQEAIVQALKRISEN